MKKIKLTRNKIALVDDSDFDYLNQWKWFALDSRGKFYAVRSVGKCVVQMHREILNAPKEKQVDHINGDGLNNTRKNLRLANKFENNQNGSIRKDNSSGFKGVNYFPKLKKYRAYIQAYKTNIHLGYFTTKTEAAYVYDQFAILLHGKFAKLNILPDVKEL